MVFSLLGKVGHTQKAIIKLLDKEVGGLSMEEKVQILLSKDPQDGYSPLIWAARNGAEDVILYLFQCFQTISLPDNQPSLLLDQTGGWDQTTALMKAIEFNNSKAVSVLIDLHVNFDIKDHYGSTALMLAAERGLPEIVDKLIKFGANVNIQNKFGYTALMVAAEKGHKDIIRLLADGGADKELVNQLGKTALMVSAENNKVDCIITLFEDNVKREYPTSDPKINHQCNRGMTALMYAAMRGHAASVTLLLDRGANTILRCKDGNFAMTYAFNTELCPDWETGFGCLTRLLIAQKLMAKQLPENLKNNKGCTPFMLASESGQLEVLELLLAGKNKKQVEHMCLETSKDGSTALHLAATNGHIKVLLYLTRQCPSSASLRTKQGRTPTKLLANCYVNNQRKLSEFMEELTSSRSTSFRFKRELFELIPEILPVLKSPNNLLNEWFGKVLLAIKHGDEIDIVTHLVLLSVGLKLAMIASPLEATDLEERLGIVQHMLIEVMRVREMDKDHNVLLLMECRRLLNREFSESLHSARAFMQGPLMLCLRHKFLAILGTRQLNVFVDLVFNNSLRVKQPRPPEALIDIFQMRSNCTNWRTNPAFNFYFEGFCKFMTFCAVTVILWQQSPLTRTDHIQPNYELDFFVLMHFLLEVIIFGWVLCEFGKLQFQEFNLTEYFWEMWVYLDVATVVLHISWSVCMLTTTEYGDYAASGFNSNITAATITNWDIPHPPAKGLLALSAVLLAMNFLKYMSTSAELGCYVLMVLAMVWNARNFFVIFLVCSLGYLVAFHGLFPFMFEFRTTERTALELLFSLNGQFSSSPSIFEDDPNETLGILLFATYITMSGAILMNIMTATFAAIYNEINDESRENWCYMKAKVVQQYLLVKPKNPLQTLPSPFNLIPLLFSPFHYAYIHLQRIKMCTKTPPISPTSMKQEPGFASIKETTGFMSMKEMPKASSTDTVHHETNHICVCDCHREAATYLGHRDMKCLSICGTVSDITIGVLLLFPCAFYEMYLCLEEIRKRQKNKNLVWMCLVVAIIGFPFFYLGFVITLLIEIARVRTWLVFDESASVQVLYEEDKKALATTPSVAMHPDTKYITLSIKIISAELIDRGRSLLGQYLYRTSNIYAVMRIGNQILVTNPVKGVDSKRIFRDARKDFLLCLADAGARSSVARFDLFDESDTLLGTCTESINNWIATGRFEGSLELQLNSEVVGKVLLVAEVEQTEYQPIKVPVTVTSISAQVARCTAVDRKSLTMNTRYAVRLSFGKNYVQTSNVECGGFSVTFNQLLCVSMDVNTLDDQNDILKVELLKVRISAEESGEETLTRPFSAIRIPGGLQSRRTSKTDRYIDPLVLIASCVVATNGLVNEDINGEYEMFNGSDCVCKIELSIMRSTETVMAQKPKSAQWRWKKAYQKVLVMLRLKKFEGKLMPPGHCACGEQVAHSCRSKRNRMKLFQEGDLDRIFLGVESEHECAPRTEFSYELHNEIKKVKEQSEKHLNKIMEKSEAHLNKVMKQSEQHLHKVIAQSEKHDCKVIEQLVSVQTDLMSLNKTVLELSTRLEMCEKTGHEATLDK